MAYFHGARTEIQPAPVPTPLVSESGISFAIGAAPVHTVDGKANEVVMANTFKEAVAQLGYSDDWEKYPLCEVMDTHFRLFKVSPVFFLNVLDPSAHQADVSASDLSVVDGTIQLPLEAIADSVVVKPAGGTGNTYVRNEDYVQYFTDTSLVIEILPSGSIETTVTKLSVAYKKVTPETVSEADIIGGFDVDTKKFSGLELLDTVFPRFGIAPEILLAPGFSHKEAVASILAAKADSINGLFKAKAFIDVDSESVPYYGDVPAWKKDKGLDDKNIALFYPLGKANGRVYHLSSLAAALAARVDIENGGLPGESFSNKNPYDYGAATGAWITSTVTASGEEVIIDPMQANHLNANGIVTAQRLSDGFVLWGDEAACFPDDGTPQNRFLSVSRMMDWAANTITLTYLSKVDRKMTQRLLDSIVDALNIWLNGLTSAEKILGGHVEFNEDENSAEEVMSGRSVFHVYMTPASPAIELEFLLEYDAEIVAALAAE